MIYSMENYLLTANLVKKAYLKAKQYADEKAELGFEVYITDELPEEPNTNTIYLLSNQEEENYEEWLYVKDENDNYSWKKIGTTGIDFSNYYTKEEVTATTEAQINKKLDSVINNVNDTHFYSKNFDNKEYTFTRSSSLKAGNTYLLLFNNEVWTNGVYTMYNNIGDLYALTNSTVGNAKYFSSEISEDRNGITVEDISNIDNAMWICEPYNNSSTQFTLKNVHTQEYLYNNNGSIGFSTSAPAVDNRFAWQLVNRNAEDDVFDTSPYQGTKEAHIFSTITSVSESNKFLRISHGTNVFKFGNLTEAPKDGRNGGVYLYKFINDSYEVNLHDSDVLKITRSSDVSYNTEGNLVINTTAPAVDLFTITLPEQEIERNYRKIIVEYEHQVGSRTGFKYQKSDGSEKFENNDNFRFPTDNTSKTIEIENDYQPVKKLFIISFATGSRTVIKSITFTDSVNASDTTTKTKEYTVEPFVTKTQRAKSIELDIDTSNLASQSVYVTNELGVASPTWYDATEAVRVKTPYVFSSYSDVPANNGGIGVKVIVSGGATPAYCSSINYKVTYEADETGDLPIVDSTDNGKILKVIDGEWDKGTVEESNEVVVTITRNGSNYSSSHTYNQINTLIQQGKKVIAKYDNIYYPWNPGQYYAGFGSVSEYKNPYVNNQVRLVYFGWITSTDDLDSTSIRYFYNNACLLPDVTNIGVTNKNYALKPTLTDNKLGWEVVEVTADTYELGTSADSGKPTVALFSASGTDHVHFEGEGATTVTKKSGNPNPNTLVISSTDTTYTLSEVAKSDTQYGDGAEIKLTNNDGNFSSVALTAIADSGIVIQPVTGQTNIFNISLAPSIKTQLDELAQLRADIEYLAMMTNINLSNQNNQSSGSEEPQSEE